MFNGRIRPVANLIVPEKKYHGLNTIFCINCTSDVHIRSLQDTSVFMAIQFHSEAKKPWEEDFYMPIIAGAYLVTKFCFLWVFSNSLLHPRFFDNEFFPPQIFSFFVVKLDYFNRDSFRNSPTAANGNTCDEKNHS